MNGGLLVLGFIILIGAVFVNINIDQNELEENVEKCNSFLGGLGQQFSEEVDERCEEANKKSEMASYLPLAYVVGGLLFVLGLAMPSGKNDE